MARTSQKDPFLCVKAGVVEGTESFETHCCLKRRASRLETEGVTRTSQKDLFVRACKGRRREWKEKERHERIKKDLFVPVKVGVVKGKEQRVV